MEKSDEARDILIARIKERLKAVGMSAQQAAKAAGFERTYLNQLFSGKKESLVWENLVKIAEVLDCDPLYLKGEIDAPRAVDPSLPAAPEVHTEPSNTVRTDIRGGITLSKDELLQVEGEISADVWSGALTGTSSDISIARDSRYRRYAQRAYQVRGNAWERLGFFDRSIVTIAIMPARDGDIVLVKITRENGESQYHIGLSQGDKVELPHPIPSSWTVETLGVVVMENRIF